MSEDLRQQADQFRASGLLGKPGALSRLFDFLLERSLAGDVPKEMEIAWAIVHPPFYAAFAAPDGSIWLEKSKPAADSIRRIHVLDRAGSLQRVMVIKGQGRLLSVGPEYLLIGERLPEGVGLMQVRIPQRATASP